MTMTTTKPGEQLAGTGKCAVFVINTADHSNGLSAASMSYFCGTRNRGVVLMLRHR